MAGFSLVDLLVTLGATALLTALLLPAVQEARETSRKTVCSSHARQIVDAFHSHEAAYGVFPGAMFEQQSWLVQVLPYLEQPKPLIDDFGKRVSGPNEIEVMLCPSDPEAGGRFDDPRGHSYQINGGSGNHLRDGFYCSHDFTPLRAAEITDGLSATLAIAERLVPPESRWWEQEDFNSSYWRRRTIRKTGSFHVDLDEFADNCELYSSPPGFRRVIPSSYNHIQTPNRLSCTNGNRNDTRSLVNMAVTATSLHPAGVNGCCADGSVRFYSDAIDRFVWRRLGTRAGAE